jgi:hypothetical protein
MNLHSFKAQTEALARSSFRFETFPHGLSLDIRGRLEVLALDLSVVDAIHHVARKPQVAAALICEAVGVHGEDILAITVDHPEGLLLGRIDVTEGEHGGDDGRKLGPIEWTTEIVTPTPGRPVRFPTFTRTGKIVAIDEDDRKRGEAFRLAMTPGTPEHAAEEVRLEADRKRREAEAVASWGDGGAGDECGPPGGGSVLDGMQKYLEWIDENVDDEDDEDDEGSDETGGDA